ncbi:MAG: ActS/PrrB/RegB family redox-sensitive histidine kinase [Rhodospirillaceae bacterium]
MRNRLESDPPEPVIKRGIDAFTVPGGSRRDGRVAGRTLVVMRWIAVSGQLCSIGVITGGLGIILPLGPVLATIGTSILLNLLVFFQRETQARLTDRDATLYLAFDTLQLTLLLYLTGGMINPFTILLLAPMTVGAAILSPFNVALLAVLNQACLAVLAFWHFPLPWHGKVPALPSLYLSGVWSGLAMASVMLAAYVARVAYESRRVGDALTASQMALAREQRLSALGGLAAAAAHELGTPLGTIALVATELAREIPPGSPLAEDIALLQSQSQRCGAILAELSRRPEADGGEPFEHVPLTVLVETAAIPHLAGPTSLVVMAERAGGLPDPVVRRQPEIIHGVGNLLQNALQFAHAEVRAVVGGDTDQVTLTITDDGPGFPSGMLSRLGEPYLSARADSAGHMGLGIFIAETLLSRTGASVEFGNRRRGGARVVVRWNRRALLEQVS